MILIMIVECLPLPKTLLIVVRLGVGEVGLEDRLKQSTDSRLISKHRSTPRDTRIRRKQERDPIERKRNNRMKHPIVEILSDRIERTVAEIALHSFRIQKMLWVVSIVISRLNDDPKSVLYLRSDPPDFLNWVPTSWAVSLSLTATQEFSSLKEYSRNVNFCSNRWLLLSIVVVCALWHDVGVGGGFTR